MLLMFHPPRFIRLGFLVGVRSFGAVSLGSVRFGCPVRVDSFGLVRSNWFVWVGLLGLALAIHDVGQDISNSKKKAIKNKQPASPNITSEECRKLYFRFEIICTSMLPY